MNFFDSSKISVIRGIRGKVCLFGTKQAVVPNRVYRPEAHQALAQSYLRKEVLTLSTAGIMH